MSKKPEYSRPELRVLWYIKRNGGVLTRRGKESILTRMADELHVSVGAVRYTLRRLEERSLVLRTYKYARPKEFGDGSGNNPLLKLELVDPKMALPPEPKAPSLQQVMIQENIELAHRLIHEPERDHVIEALVDRALELQQQVDRLQALVESLSAENEQLKRRNDRRETQPAHLSQRVRDALTPEQWDDLQTRARSADEPQ